MDYSGHWVVRVDVQDASQLEQLLAISPDIWSEHVGFGQPIEARIPPDRVEALNASGLPYTILIDDIQKWIDIEQAARLRRDATWFESYHTLAEIEAYLDDLVANFPTLISKYPIGQSVEGRTIYGLTITSPNGPASKPAISFSGLQHAREWISPATVTYIVDRLVSQYAINPDVTAMLDGLTFYVAPVMNPDGYVHTWNGQRLWRKNRRNNGDGTYGVDLNRNWDWSWCTAGASSSTGEETYCGPSPASEPETQALVDYILDRPDIVAHIDWHSYSQLVLRPFGHDYVDPSEPDYTIIYNIGQDMRDAIYATHAKSYTHEAAYDLYLAAGTCQDWVYGVAGVYSWTIELRPASSLQGGFVLPPEQIIPTGEESFAAVRELTDWALSLTRTTISLPNGAPSILVPLVAETIDVEIASVGESLVPGSATLHYRYDGGVWQSEPLTHISGSLYQATLSGATCDDEPAFYLSAEGSASGLTTDPAGAPASFYAAAVGEFIVSFADNFETDTGWTQENLGATSGDWQRGVPTNDPNWAYGPATDSDGSGQCWLTENENNPSYPTPYNTDVDNGAVRLTSPDFDMSGGGSIAYDYFLRLTDSDGSDRLLVEASSNGTAGPWVEVARHDTDGGLSWRSHVITQADLAAAGLIPSADMQLRFTANDSGTQSIVEAGIDAFSVTSVTCEVTTCVTVPGDMNGDSLLDGADIQGFVDTMTQSPYFSPCADMALPAGAPIDAADISTFVAALLALP